MKKMQILDVNGRRIPYSVLRRDVRNIYLRIGRDLRVEVVLPLKEKISMTQFLMKKLPWIEKKVIEITQMKRLFNNKKILYKGEPITVKVFQMRIGEDGVGSVKQRRRRKSVRLYKRVLHLYENYGRKWENLLEEFVAQMTLQTVERDTKKWEKRLGVKVSSLNIKDMKIWGYCKQNGDLYFNSKLVCLPENLRNYVVLHELLHLKHFDHSKRYKRELAKYYFDYKEAERMLKNYLP